MAIWLVVSYTIFTSIVLAVTSDCLEGVYMYLRSVKTWDILVYSPLSNTKVSAVCFPLKFYPNYRKNLEPETPLMKCFSTNTTVEYKCSNFEYHFFYFFNRISCIIPYRVIYKYFMLQFSKNSFRTLECYKKIMLFF